MEIFNKEDVYDNQISPLIQQIIAICNENGIPMLASFAYENHPERGIGCCTTLINDVENRKSETFQQAAKHIRTGGHQTFAIAVKTKTPA